MNKSIAPIFAFCLLLLGVLLSSCSPTSKEPIRQNLSATHPQTIVKLSDGKRLEHSARRRSGLDAFRGLNQEKLLSSATPANRSHWKLFSGEGSLLAKSPSMFTDPKYASIDFKEYYQEADMIEIIESPSANTVLISEDRSPTYPNRKFFLFRKTKNQDWEVRILSIGSYGTPDEYGMISPISRSYPKILTLSDKYLKIEKNGKKEKLFLNKIPSEIISQSDSR